MDIHRERRPNHSAERTGMRKVNDDRITRSP
jgi:hypothetical protein